MAARNAEDALDFLLGDVKHVGQFLFRWRALELLFQAADFFFEFIEGSQLVGGETHDARVLGDGLKDGLAYPPNGVGYEFEAASLVEAFGGLNQSNVAFVDEVGKTEALVLVLLGNGDDEAQVGLGEAVEGFLVAGFDTLCQTDFLLRSEQLFTANILQVFVERLDVAVGDGMGNF